MKKILSSIMLTAFMFMSIGTSAIAGTLPANTPITIQANESFGSNTLHAGDSVNFSVVSDIALNGSVVIPAGTLVGATVKKAKARRRIGVPGEIIIGDFYTTSINGVRIPLNGNVIEKGKSKMGLSIALSAIVIPFFLLMKGKDISVLPGYQYTVFTTSDTNL